MCHVPILPDEGALPVGVPEKAVTQPNSDKDKHYDHDQSEDTSCHAVQQRMPERLRINDPSVVHYQLWGM
jgi:hypothetical protein